MARKTAKQRTPTKTRDDGRTRLELRFDDDVYQGVKALADEVGISVNQLMQGLARWAVSAAHVGEPDFDEHGDVHTRAQAGCVWFGNVTDAEEGPDGEVHLVNSHVAFVLDFTERRVVRDDWKEQRSAK